jgi:hypothetical protein
MRQTSRLLAGVLGASLLVPEVAAAQNTTADGVAAMARGDYDAAAAILRPLALDTPKPDPLAQFFLGLLYASRGPDMGKGCGLLLLAGSSDQPLAQTAQVLARFLEDQQPFCREPLDVKEVSPTTFELGPDHTVTFDGEGVAVRSGRETNRTQMWTLNSAGAVFLPPLYTPLDVSFPVSTRRHFVQFFSWWPETSADRPTWALRWFVGEVAGTEFRVIAGSGPVNHVKVGGLVPPAPFDLRSAADVLVGGNGEAEWIIRSDPPERGAIPMDAQR